MPDDKTKKHPRDGKRIDVNDPSEVRYWRSILGVTEKDLKNAVDEVGDSVKSVKSFLGK